MADLSALIRLHKYELDEKRRALSELYGALAEIDKRRNDLELAFEQEKEAVSRSGDVHFTFAQYAENVRKEREELDRAALLLDRKIEAAKDSMMETFSELKKYEMTQEERDRLEREEIRVREGKTMDDIGLEGFRRGRGEQ